MYKIKNTTRGKLILTDIGVKLNAGETVDLDALLPREKIESSAHLKVAESNELIAILHKDVVAVLTQSPVIDPVMLMEMEQRIRAQITEQMAQQKTETVVEPKPQIQQPQQDLSGISSKLEQLLAAFANTPQNPQFSQPSFYEVEEHTTNADKLVEVHAKALQRLTKSAEGHVEATSSTHSSDISDRADELGDFLK